MPPRAQRTKQVEYERQCHEGVRHARVSVVTLTRRYDDIVHENTTGKVVQKHCIMDRMYVATYLAKYLDDGHDGDGQEGAGHPPHHVPEDQGRQHHDRVKVQPLSQDDWLDEVCHQ